MHSSIPPWGNPDNLEVSLGTTQEAYDRNAAYIATITSDNLRPRFESMEDLFLEISELINHCNEDKDLFAKIPRFNIEYIITLDDRYLTLLHAFSLYTEISLDKNVAESAWKKIEPKAQRLKRIIIEALQFAYEEEERFDDLAKINEIAVGSGKKDLYCDYVELRSIATRDLPLLVSMGVSETAPADMEAIFEQLIPLFGSLEAPSELVEERALIVKQAYTWLYEAVDSIRRYGKFIHADNPKRLVLYKSKSRIENGKSSARARKDESKSLTL